ncbi:unnamed protein product, partial [Closterium sp. NIES-53]
CHCRLLIGPQSSLIPRSLSLLTSVVATGASVAAWLGGSEGRGTSLGSRSTA